MAKIRGSDWSKSQGSYLWKPEVLIGQSQRFLFAKIKGSYWPKPEVLTSQSHRDGIGQSQRFLLVKVTGILLAKVTGILLDKVTEILLVKVTGIRMVKVRGSYWPKPKLLIQFLIILWPDCIKLFSRPLREVRKEFYTIKE